MDTNGSGIVTKPGDSERAAFMAWLRGLDLDELAGYRAELEAFEGDGSEFGAFSEWALRRVRLVQAQVEARERMRPSFEMVFPDVPIEAFLENLGAIGRAAEQLDSDTEPLEILTAALESARAASARDSDEGAR
jgi:hypothetical protein